MAQKRLTPVAQRLRRNPTEAEKRLWARLRNRQLGVHFTRQLPIAGYIADFSCRAARLVIEVDGGQHAESVADEERTRAIEAAGFKVVRFWNNDILRNTDGVVTAIIRELAIAAGRT